MDGGMGRVLRMGFALASVALCTVAADAEAQGRGGKRSAAQATADVSLDVTLSVGVRDEIRAFYTTRPAVGVQSLPPGIRKNLARGKPLPPGIAKKVAPPELVSRIALPDGHELVEVGLDVLLVEVATGVIHDVLMDVIR